MRAARQALAVLGICLAAGAPARAAEEPEAGVYCPLPKAGEVPRCLGPAQAEYGEFFQGLEEGELDDGATARVEADLAADTPDERAYLALSTLAYAYYRLSLRAAEGGDPAVASRIARWNQVLSGSYQAHHEDPAFQDSLRGAALDLRDRAPAVALDCRDAEGRPVACDSTDELVRAIDRIQERTGIRGALTRILESLLGAE